MNFLLEVPPVGGGVQQGIAFVSPPPDQAPNTGVIVRANTVVGMRDGIVAAGAPNATRPSIIQSQLSNNVTSDNLRDGIVLRGGNTANAVRGNLAERNGRFASLDARDDARQLNLWIGNRCSTDFPEGTICASD